MSCSVTWLSPQRMQKTQARLHESVKLFLRAIQRYGTEEGEACPNWSPNPGRSKDPETQFTNNATSPASPKVRDELPRGGPILRLPPLMMHHVPPWRLCFAAPCSAAVRGPQREHRAPFQKTALCRVFAPARCRSCGSCHASRSRLICAEPFCHGGRLRLGLPARLRRRICRA